MWISINILQKYYLFTSSLPDKPACTSRSEAGDEEVEDEEVKAEVVEDGGNPSYGSWRWGSWNADSICYLNKFCWAGL